MAAASHAKAMGGLRGAAARHAPRPHTAAALRPRGPPRPPTALPTDDDAAPFPFPSDLLGGPASSPSALLDRAQRETLREVDAIIRRFDQLDRGVGSPPSTTSAAERGGARTWTERALPGGGQSWHREERSEQRTNNGYSRSWRSETVAVWGVTPELPPCRPAATSPSLISLPVVLAALAAGAYAAVAAAFARRFESGTTYKTSAKPLLVGLWPLLAVVSHPFRRQLRTALAAKVAAEEGIAGTPPPPARLPRGPSQTAGGRTTADSSLLRPQRNQNRAVDWSSEL